MVTVHMGANTFTVTTGDTAGGSASGVAIDMNALDKKQHRAVILELTKHMRNLINGR